jgi:hypothetical protein
MSIKRIMALSVQNWVWLVLLALLHGGAGDAAGQTVTAPWANVQPDQPQADEDDAGVQSQDLAGTYPFQGILLHNVDIVASGNCPSGLFDRISNSCGTVQGVTANSTSFTTTVVAGSGQVLPSLATMTNVGPSSGFTVIAGLNTSYAVSVPQTVFTVYPNSSAADPNGLHFAFTLIRDTQGFWHTGKFVDGVFSNNSVYYLNRAWDPVSPCVQANSCAADYIYVNFMPNGEILLDEFAILVTPNRFGSNVSWQSGTLLYGYPVTGYQIGQPATAPTQIPLYYPAATVNIGSLPQGMFTATPGQDIGSYPQATLINLAVWGGGTMGLNQTIAGLWGQELTDLSNRLGGIHVDPTWLPCNSGAFQTYNDANLSAPAQPSTYNFQGYNPQTLNTPCASEATRYASLSVTPRSLVFPFTSSSSGIHLTSAQTLPVTVSNASGVTSNLTVSNVSIKSFNSSNTFDASLFSVQNACSGSLVPGASCSIDITFTPNSGLSGAYTNAYLSFYTNSAGGNTEARVPLIAGVPIPTLSVSNITNSSFDLHASDPLATSIIYGLATSDTSFPSIFSNLCFVSLYNSGDYTCKSLPAGVTFSVFAKGSWSSSGTVSDVATQIVTTSVSAPILGTPSQIGSTSVVVPWFDVNSLTAQETVNYSVRVQNGAYGCTTSTNATSQCTITALTAATSFSLSATETVNGIVSTSSNVITVTTGVSEPVSLAASNLSPTGFTLNWTDPNIYGSGITPVYNVTLNGAAASCVAVGTSCTITGLTQATTYSLGVYISAGGQTSSSARSTVTTLAYVSVNLYPTANVYAFYRDGSTYSNGGLDGGGSSYPAGQFATTYLVDGVPVSLGNANMADAVNLATISVPLGHYSSLNILATGVGNQNNQIFTVRYTDGSSATFNQSLSDWWRSPSRTLLSGEMLIASSTYVDQAAGHTYSQVVCLDGYQFPLDPSKLVQSFTLPSNKEVIVLGASLAGIAAGIPVSLTNYWDVNAINTDGTSFNTGGIDGTSGNGSSYSANMLGSTLLWNNSLFTFGQSGTSNGVRSKTVALPTGNFAAINLVATAVRGNQGSQNFIVTYTDNSTQIFTQSLSDWYTPQNYSGESIAIATQHRELSSGSTQNETFDLYGYSFALNTSKMVKSIQLPSNDMVVVLGVSLVPVSSVVSLGSSWNVNAINLDGSAFNTGGADGSAGNGNTYSFNAMGPNLSWNGSLFTFGQPGALNAARNNTVILPNGSFGAVNLLATGVNGDQGSQNFVVTYTDNSTQTFTQSISDWYTPQAYAGESIALQMSHRDGSSGTTDYRALNLYGYSFALNASKTVKSIQLPGNDRVVVLGISLLGPTGIVETPTSSSNPSKSGQAVTLSSVIDTGGNTPSGLVSFYVDGVSFGTSTLTTISATNLLPYSQQLTNTSFWTAYCTYSGFTGDNANTTDLTAPDGTQTATKFVVPGSGVGCGASSAWGEYTGAVALSAGQSYTVSVWLLGAQGGEPVNIGLNDCAQSQVTLTTSWQRYNLTFPSISSNVASCDGGRAMQIVGENSSTFYAWGAQLEKSASMGPYVATTGTATTGYGGTGSLVVVFNSSGATADGIQANIRAYTSTHSITAVYTGSGSIKGSTSPSTLQQTVNP